MLSQSQGGPILLTHVPFSFHLTTHASFKHTRHQVYIAQEFVISKFWFETYKDSQIVRQTSL